MSASTFARSLLATATVLACAGAHATTINIASRDPAGVGFNDPTPVAPVGGNPGTTLGQQRYNVYRYVADLWEKAIDSPVVINVSAGWEPLACNANSATLGSAGAWNIWWGFNGGKPGTWYPQALANKLAGVNLSEGWPDDGSGYGTVDIKTQFNINLGKSDCLAGAPFYLGLDGKSGDLINFATTLLHELGHGLGFSVQTVQTATGNRINADGSAFTPSGLPSVWEQFMYDNTAGKTWLNMTSAERKASAVNPLKLAWSGPNAVAGAAATLAKAPVIRISTAVPGVAGSYLYGSATFGPAISAGQALGNLGVVAANPAGAACQPLGSSDAAAVRGKTAIVDRGACPFVVKVKNAQDAGAVGVIIANNAAGGAPGMTGVDPTITIPTLSVSQSDAAILKYAVANAAKYGSRSAPGTVFGMLQIDATRRKGTDGAGRPLLYTPNPLVPGSSVSHWDVSAVPNLLMEPNINGDLTTSLVPPLDLTVPLLKDIGW